MEEFEKWRLLNATDLQSLIYPCSSMYSLLGLFPCKYEPPTYKHSKARVVLLLFSMLLYASSLLIVLYYINFTTVISDDEIETVSNNLYYLLEGVCMVVYVLYHSFTYAETAMFREMLKISTMLSPKEYNDLSKFIHAKDVIGFLFLLIHVPNCFTHEVATTLCNCCSLYTEMVNFLIDMFYSDLICVVKACFKKLNESLKKLTFTLEGNTGVNPLSPRVKFLLLTKLKNLEEEHLKISYVVEGLNDNFLIRNIVMTCSTFIIVTFNMYYYLSYRQPSYSDEAAYHSYYWYVPYTLSAFFHFVKFVMVIWTCETAANEARKIKTIIHEVVSSATDAETKNEAKLFSLQILHKDNIFTAKAIDMNAELLSKVVGGITMYIIILFQFLLNSAMCAFAKAS